MTLNDGTGIAHSEIIYKDNQENVKVYFEQPVENGFNFAECWLPSYTWTKKEGFSEEQQKFLQEFALQLFLLQLFFLYINSTLKAVMWILSTV